MGVAAKRLSHGFVNSFLVIMLTMPKVKYLELESKLVQRKGLRFDGPTALKRSRLELLPLICFNCRFPISHQFLIGCNHVSKISQ